MGRYWLLWLVALLALPGLALAAEFRSSEDDQAIIEESEPTKDLYMVGANVVVNSPTNGDLTLAGDSLLINGDISNSLFAAGRIITIRGKVGHHVRVLGATVNLSGDVAGDVFVAAEKITIAEDAVINGDLIAAAGELRINGTINGQVKTAGRNVSVSGKILGPSVFRAERLIFNETAQTLQSVRYYGVNEAEVKSGADLSSKIAFTKISSHFFSNNFGRASVWLFFLGLIGRLLIVLLFVYFLPKASMRLVEQAQLGSGKRFLVGLGFLFLTPIVALILLFSAVGTVLAGLGFLFWVALIALAHLFGQIYLGKLAEKLLKRGEEKSISAQTGILGVLASYLIGLIPILGGLFNFVIFAISLGTLFGLSLSWLRTQRQTA